MAQFEMEPADPPAVTGEVLEAESAMALARSLPEGFNLSGLLRFLPDIRLKHRIKASADAALAVNVESDGGLQAADAALVPLRADIAQAERDFKEPTSLANQLHKRLTGLFRDFTGDGVAALETVGGRIMREKRRRDALAEQARQKAQAEADRKVREQAAEAAKRATKSGAPAAVVENLKAAAKTATAPPVASPAPAPALQSSTAAANWKARLKGTPDDAEPNPQMGQLTPAQQEQVRRLMLAVTQGLEPLALFEINWSVINGRAKGEKTTLSITEIEAYDAGSLRSRGRR